MSCSLLASTTAIDRLTLTPAARTAAISGSEPGYLGSPAILWQMLSGRQVRRKASDRVGCGSRRKSVAEAWTGRKNTRHLKVNALRNGVGRAQDLPLIVFGQ
jgi:hypothetical protein